MKALSPGQISITGLVVTIKGGLVIVYITVSEATDPQLSVTVATKLVLKDGLTVTVSSELIRVVFSIHSKV